MTFDPEWLALREQADAEARADDLVELLRPTLEQEHLVIRDLGCGTGSMGRWLAPRLAAGQHWVLHDHDSHLLELAAKSLLDLNVTVETCHGDIGRLRASDLTGTSLVTASALLDVLTLDELNALATACVSSGVSTLLTLSVVGKVELDPVDPLDAAFQVAFNAHQRRVVDGRRLLGPDAVPAAVEAFGSLGAQVVTRPSPWRLGPDEAALTQEWLQGWVGAACEQQPALYQDAPAYLRRRADADLRVTVGHADLVAFV
ncbi:class I SAM-dependent methyltransferase [Pseudonocardiaceae bacterium YIM PH 21723]|nr:class I SAM-dependent methyltransferase [Pseudonocardiaceae bacterium YIM PH 21723]